MKLADLLIDSKIVKDRSEAQRFVIQCEVNVNGKREDCSYRDLVEDDVISITSPKTMRVIRIKGKTI